MQSKDQTLTPNLTVSRTLLGKGSTGNVYIGHSLTPQPHQVAVKSIPLSGINNQVTSYLLQCELEALKTISSCGNPSIIKLEDIVVIDGSCHIVTEILNGGTLRELMDKKKIIQTSLAIRILRSLLSGCQTLEKNGIIHRDLKPTNILFLADPTSTQEAPVPKIIDFGYCIYDKVQKKPTSYYNVGSPRYMSPEAYMQNQYSNKSDIWALGIIFYEMLTGACLDKGKALEDSFEILRKKGIPIPALMDTQPRRILQGMLMVDPKKRMSCSQLIQLIDSNQHLMSSNSIMEAKKIQQKQGDQNPIQNHSPQRASLIFTNPQLGNSTFLTRSVGFAINPQLEQNDKHLNNFLQIKLEQSKFERNEVLLTDRSNYQWQLRGRGLLLSSSLQNLQKTVQNIALYNSLDKNFAFQQPLAQGQQFQQERNLTTPSQNSKTGNILMELRQSININFGEQSKAHVIIKKANHSITQSGKQIRQNNIISSVAIGQAQQNRPNIHGLQVQLNQAKGQHISRHLQQIQPQHYQHQQTPQQFTEQSSLIKQPKPYSNQNFPYPYRQQQHQIQFRPNHHEAQHIIQNFQTNQSPRVTPQLHPFISHRQSHPIQPSSQHQQFQQHPLIEKHYFQKPINLNPQQLQFRQSQPEHYFHHQQHTQQSAQNHPQQFLSHILFPQPFREQNKSEIIKANRMINKNIRIIPMIPQQPQILQLRSKLNENARLPIVPQMHLIKGRI